MAHGALERDAVFVCVCVCTYVCGARDFERKKHLLQKAKATDE